MSLPIRAYRLGTARNAYESHGETVRRLVDQILGDLTGLSFSRLATEVEAYQNRLGRSLYTDAVGLDGEPEPDQDTLGEPEGIESTRA